MGKAISQLVLGILLVRFAVRDWRKRPARGERAAHVLDGWRVWLAAHNTAMMAVLFLVFGAVLFSQGLRGLT
jgi:hypothetical protein